VKKKLQKISRKMGNPFPPNPWVKIKSPKNFPPPTPLCLKTPSPKIPPLKGKLSPPKFFCRFFFCRNVPIPFLNPPFKTPQIMAPHRIYPPCVNLNVQTFWQKMLKKLFKPSTKGPPHLSLSLKNSPFNSFPFLLNPKFP